MFDTSGLEKFNEVKDRTKKVNYPRRYADIVSLLLANGADINRKSSVGGTPLFMAARSGSLDMAELLVAKGADVNAKEDSGYTPLMVAALNNNTNMVNLFLSKGATVDIFIASAMGNVERVKDFWGKTPG